MLLNYKTIIAAVYCCQRHRLRFKTEVKVQQGSMLRIMQESSAIVSTVFKGLDILGIKSCLQTLISLKGKEILARRGAIL